MSDGGFVLMYRSVMDHHVFRNQAEAMTFAWMVLRATWQPYTMRYKGRAIDLKRGQLVMSVRDLADAMDRDKAWIERLFARLKRETMIATTNETGVNVITICNYDVYQPSAIYSETVHETDRETPARQSRDTEETRELLEDIPEPSGSGAAPDTPDLFGANEQDLLPDPQTIMFNAGKKLLQESGIPPARAGPILGRWRRDFGAEAVIVALGRAQREGAIDPVSYIEGCLRNGTGNRNQGGGYGSDFRDPVLADLAFGSGS